MVILATYYNIIIMHTVVGSQSVVLELRYCKKGKQNLRNLITPKKAVNML